MVASSEPILRARLDALAEREPEAVAAPWALLEIGLSLRLLLTGERLRVRETDAPAPFFHREDQHLHLAPDREGLARVGAAAHGELGGGHQPGLPGTKAHEHAEGLVALDGAGEHRSHLYARLHMLPRFRALRRQRERDASLVAVHADDQDSDLGARSSGLAQGSLPAPGNLRHVQKTVHAGQELDEDSELGRAHRAPAHHLPLAQPPG